MIAASMDVKLTLQGPVLTCSTVRGRFGVDAMMAQSGNHFYLPGTLVKGLIGEAWQELGGVSPEFRALRNHWLGQKSSTQNLPARGALYFEDFVDRETSVEGTRTQYRIEIDPERGSVKHGHYLVIDAPYPSGKPVIFEGTLWALAKNRQEVNQLRSHTQTALRWIMSVGSERSIGFGRVLDAQCSPPECVGWQAETGDKSSPALSLELSFTRPVCFARRRVANNLFESEPWLTGASLKGALATLLSIDQTLWPHLREHLHEIRFTHAFPAGASAPRPVYPPESLVKVNDETRDAIFLKDPPTGSIAVPEFRVDWKDESDVWRLFGWPDLKRELRVRTAIDGELRRAEDQSLFAYQMIVPDGVSWQASVLLDGVEESVRAEVAAELRAALEHGLFALGKTKARAAIIAKPIDLKTAQLRGDTVAITLQTAALLCDPSRHLAPNGQIGSSDRDAMRAEYRDVWSDLSGTSLELENYFHRVSLAGGGYLRHRFQTGDPYRPYLLTDPGSVFLLRIKDRQKASDCVTRWLRRGLDLSGPVRHFYRLGGIAERELWKSCPFLPENGFGEIAIDLHETQRDGVEVWHV